MMVENIKTSGGERLASFGRSDVGPNEFGPLGDIRFVAAREIVQDGDVPALTQVPLRDVGSDESGPTRDQYPAAHAPRLGIPISCNWLVDDHRPGGAPRNIESSGAVGQRGRGRR